MKPTDNHPGLSSGLYADAFWARAKGDADRAWALEEEAFTQLHYTPIDCTSRGLAKLRHGDFSGWRDYELRLHDARHKQRMGLRFMWTHEPFKRYTCDAYWNWTERPGWERELRDATIMIGREGGIGDMIMLSRFIPWVALHAKTVFWLVPEEFKRLAEWLNGDVVEVITQEELPPFDYYAMMFSLPALVGEMIPWHEGYRGCVRRGLQRTESHGSATGVCWAGSPLYADMLPLYGNTDIRSMDQEAARRLGLALADTVPPPRISYQRGGGRFDMGAACQGGVVTDERITGDWYDTAMSLDRECARVVTVDTGLAHLAGAIGIPTYTLLALDHCWRWGGEQSRTLWYPSMRLIQQQQPGDWSYPIAEVVRQLKAEQ